MALCSFADWNPTGTTPGGPITPRVVILHVIDGEGDAKPHGGLEWHFEVRYDGRIQQQVDTAYRADANYKANTFAISIETEGTANGLWTPAQIKSILKLLLWLHKEHGIKLVRCTEWDGVGIGYHTMWGAPSMWTPVAKSCPGPNRKKQFEAEIVPALASLAPAPTPTSQEEEEMPAPIIFACTNDPLAPNVRWWITDGMTKRWISTVTEAAVLTFMGLARWNNGAPYLLDWTQLGAIPVLAEDATYGDRVTDADLGNLEKELLKALEANPSVQPGLTKDDIPAVAAAVVMKMGEKLAA